MMSIEARLVTSPIFIPRSRSLTETAVHFTGRQLERLEHAFHLGAAEASAALGKWLTVPTTISIEAVDQCPLADATNILGDDDAAVCMCLMQMQGTLTGQMLLAFDDGSGLVMADLLLAQSQGTATAWGEVEISSALETMNIAGSAYLNGIARDLSEHGSGRVQLIPTPPTFLRDFAESLLQTAFVNQAAAGSRIVSARASFELQGDLVRWTFLLIPDPASLNRLAEILDTLC